MFLYFISLLSYAYVYVINWVDPTPTLCRCEHNIIVLLIKMIILHMYQYAAVITILSKYELFNHGIFSIIFCRELHPLSYCIYYSRDTKIMDTLFRQMKLLQEANTEDGYKKLLQYYKTEFDFPEDATLSIAAIVQNMKVSRHHFSVNITKKNMRDTIKTHKEIMNACEENPKICENIPFKTMVAVFNDEYKKYYPTDCNVETHK